MSAAPTYPKTLKFGSVSFAVFPTSDGRFGFRYKIGSAWQQCVRRSVVRLKQDGERIALALVNGETTAAHIDAQDRRIYISARDTLAPLDA